MAYLLVLTILQVLILLLFLKVRSIRDERAELLRILIFSSLIIIVVKYFITLVNPYIDLLFTGSASLCLVSLSSLYIRNTIFETKTSGYLILLAFFPLLLFYVFYLLKIIFASQIVGGMIYDYLDFFHQKSRTFLFAISIVYDFIILMPWAKGVIKLSKSIDGQLAISLFSIKILVLGILIIRAGFVYVDNYFEFPGGVYATLVLFLILYFRYFNSLQIYLEYLFKINALEKFYKEEYNLHKNAEMLYYASAIDQLMDQEKLFVDPDFKQSDLGKILNISEKEIQQVIKVCLGGSLKQYLNKKRIHYFLESIDQPNHEVSSVQNLISDAGFKSELEFNSAFQNEVGYPIRQFIQQKKYTFLQSGFS